MREKTAGKLQTMIQKLLLDKAKEMYDAMSEVNDLMIAIGGDAHDHDVNDKDTRLEDVGAELAGDVFANVGGVEVTEEDVTNAMLQVWEQIKEVLCVGLGLDVGVGVGVGVGAGEGEGMDEDVGVGVEGCIFWRACVYCVKMRKQIKGWSRCVSSVCMFVRKYTYTCIHVCIYACIYICTYIYIYIHM